MVLKKSHFMLLDQISIYYDEFSLWEKAKDIHHMPPSGLQIALQHI